jgi:undecaprenyl-diphosphatase
MADWLNTAFFSFDRSVFLAVNELAKNAGGVLTPLLKFVTMLGNTGWVFIVLGIVLLLFKNTRKAGVNVLIALLLGFIFTNLLLKNIIDRARPYVASEEYFEFWQFVNGVKESEQSFPSGHATVSCAAMTAIFFSFNKKWSWVAFLIAALMGFTRIYLVVHYLTDVIAGFVVGAVAGTLAALIRNYIYRILYEKQKSEFADFFLNFDLIEVIKTLKKSD